MDTSLTSRAFERSWVPAAAGCAAFVAAVELLLLGGLSAGAAAILALLATGLLTLTVGPGAGALALFCTGGYALLASGVADVESAGRARLWLATAGAMLLVAGLPAWLSLRARWHARGRDRDRARLESFEAHFRAVGEAVPQGIFLSDRGGSVTESNSRFRWLQGVGGGALPGDALFANVHPEERCGVRDRWLAAVAAGEVFRAEHRILGARGEIAVRVYAAPVGGPEGIRGYAGTVEDLSELKGVQRELVDERERAQAQLVRQLTWQATHDALTGLRNRRGFAAALDAALARDAPHCLLVIDLDGFKAVNDACGHAAGDDLLKQVAELLGTSTRSGDTLARLGGDEFAVLLEDCPAAPGQAAAEKIRAAIDALRFARDERIFQIGASIGLVATGGPGVDAERYLGLADAACYAAKAAGRNRVVEGAAGELERQAACESLLVERVRHAVRNEGFVLFAQPVRRRTERSALEYRLVPRLFGADGHWIAPEAWLPVASRSGLTRDIRRWIIASATALLAERGPAPTLRFTVHLSASSVDDDSLVGFIAERIAADGIDPALLALEVDLRSVLAAPARANAMAAAIRALGCRFVVSGFDGGSGTLAMLRSLPLDAVKLAPTLVRDAAADSGHRAIAEAINELASTFGREVLAEGVDSKAVHLAMRDLGLSGFQGEAIASIVPIEVAVWPKRETLVDQPVPDGVVGEFGVGAQVELFEQPCAVDADRLRA